jgi:hypothetical protein
MVCTSRMQRRADMPGMRFVGDHRIESERIRRETPPERKLSEAQRAVAQFLKGLRGNAQRLFDG